MKVPKNAFILLCAVFILLLVLWTVWGNTALTITEYTVTANRLPTQFSGFRVAQVSDLHNAQFDRDNQKLLSMLYDANPDIILLTGDLVDSRNTNIYAAVAFASQAVAIAPCYYVPGNHEARLSQYAKLKSDLTSCGVFVLENQQTLIEHDNAHIALIGINDPSFYDDYLFGDSTAVAEKLLMDIPRDKSLYTILLAHRPECLTAYASNNVDLVFSGHAHGGQFRFPFIGGIVAPNQGLFPQYDAGVFTEGNTTMIVSRGIGNSIIPIRFNNRPEIVIAQLHSA